MYEVTRLQKKTQNNIAHMDVIYNVHTKLILLFKYNLKS